MPDWQDNPTYDLLRRDDMHEQLNILGTDILAQALAAAIQKENAQLKGELGLGRFFHATRGNERRCMDCMRRLEAHSRAILADQAELFETVNILRGGDPATD